MRFTFIALAALVSFSSARMQQQKRQDVQAETFGRPPAGRPGFGQPFRPPPRPVRPPPPPPPVRPPPFGFPSRPRPTPSRPGQILTNPIRPTTTTSLPLVSSSSAAVPVPAPTSGCDLSGFKPTLPSPLEVPATVPRFVTYGTGVQNYTCGAAGTYTATGAVANLFDASCQASAASFGDGNTSGLPIIAEHYFQGYLVNNATASKPVFDFRNHAPLQGQADGFITVARAKDPAPAPVDPAKNVAWLQLAPDTVSNTGTASSMVFRIHTIGGQPPATCDPADKSTLSVDYKAAYLFY